MRHMTGKGECLSSSNIFVELTSMQVPAGKSCFYVYGFVKCVVLQVCGGNGTFVQHLVYRSQVFVGCCSLIQV